MNKIPFRPTFLAFLAMPAALSAALVTDGSAWSTNATGSDLNTTTPSFTSTSTKYLYTTFDAVTLAQGDTITYQTTMSFSADDASTPDMLGVRIGLFNSQGDTTPEAATGAGWQGFWVYGNGQTAYGANPDNAWTTAGIDATASGTQTTVPGSDTSLSGSSGTFDISLSLTREGTDTYSFDYSILGVGGTTYNVSTSFAEGTAYTIADHQIDTFGMKVTGAANVDSVAVVPEPSQAAMLMGLAGLLCVLRRSGVRR